MGAPRWLRLPSLRGLAVAFLGIAALAAFLWARTDVNAIDQLAPNVISEAVAFAAALTLVDAITRKRDVAQVAPLVDDAFDTIEMSARVMCQTLAIDYVHTHTKPKELPRVALPLLDFWLAEQGREDSGRQFDKTDSAYPLPAIFEFGAGAIRQLVENRHDLVAAGYAELISAGKDYQVSLNLLRILIDTNIAYEHHAMGSLSEADRLKQNDEADADYRKHAVTATRTFLTRYHDITSRPAITLSEVLLDIPAAFLPPEVRAT